MRIRSRWLPIVVMALLGLVSACGADQGTTSATTENPTQLRGVTRTDPLQVGGVSLPDETVGGNGGTFSFKAQPGQLLIAYFGYTSCPDVCPTTLANLKVARESLGADAAARLDLAMVTVDPERDTAATLSSYLSSFADRYHALRPADQAQLDTAEQAFGAESRVEKKADGTVEVSHTGTTYVVGPDGSVLVEWPFGTSSTDMAHDLRILLEGQAT